MPPRTAQAAKGPGRVERRFSTGRLPTRATPPTPHLRHLPLRPHQTAHLKPPSQPPQSQTEPRPHDTGGRSHCVRASSGRSPRGRYGRQHKAVGPRPAQCVGNWRQTLRHGGEQPRNLASGILPDAHVGQANGTFDAELRTLPLQQLEVGLVEPLHRGHRTQRVLG